MQDFSLFDERKAAQAAAFLLHKAGGRLPLIKLMKLLYLSERASFRRYGDGITGDNFVSMNNGPVLSRTYEHMNGGWPSTNGGWDAWISDRADHMLALIDPSMIRTPQQDLGALSEADMECLGEVWDEFGHMDRWALVNYTHSDACPEWEDPHGSIRQIPPARLLKAVGYAPEQVEALTKRLREQRYINASFA